MSYNYTYGPEDEFHDGANNTYDYAEENQTRLGIPDPATCLKTPRDDYNTKYAAWKSPDRVKSAPAELKAAREIFKDALIDYGEQHLFHNPKLTIADKYACGVHIPKERTPVQRPSTSPIITADTRNEREVTFGFRELGAKRMGRPKNISALIFRWGIFDTEPTDISQLLNKDTITKSPFTLKFKDSDRGKRLYFVASWQIERGGIEGPMTEIRYVIIP